jgi:arylsulfatase A-like enzyme
MRPAVHPAPPLRAALFLALALAACRPSPPPAWIPLGPLAAPALDSVPLVTRHPWSPAGRKLEPRTVELRQFPDHAVLALVFTREDWRPAGTRGLWRVPVDLLVSTAGDRLALEGPEGPFPRVPLAELLQASEPGFNLAVKSASLVLRPAGDGPPDRVTLTCRIPGPAVSGHVRAQTFSGQGLALLPGGTATVELDVPPRSVLRFATVCEPLLSGGTEGPLHLRVRLDGALLLEHVIEDPAGRTLGWQALPLPAAGVRGARLSFEAEGALALAAFLDPSVGPADVGRRGQRPWDEARPDLVVFLADTFRADNLAAAGGLPGLTPNLDRLVEEGLFFERAWSPAAWTLPAHAALFSGRYPPEVLGREEGGVGALAPSIETVAERLAAAGYRTAAFTDGGFVSGAYGLDQGFGLFSERTEHTKDLARLLENVRAFLEADDGRPVFLFVQSYRVHWPYRVSERTRAALGDRLAFPERAEQVAAAIVAEAQALGLAHVHELGDLEDQPTNERLRELYGALRRLYLGGVADLDHELGGFLDDLRGRGVLEHGALLFTSDHGEGFGEHEALFHTAAPFEEQVRVPLLLVGRGIGAERRSTPVSLIDVAPTLLALAGLPPDPRSPGRSLLEERGADGPGRALLAFEALREEQDEFFVLEDHRKILLSPATLAARRLIGAYDLGDDPGERRDVSPSADWPREMLERHAGPLERLLETRPRTVQGEYDERKLEELRALGY